MSDIILDIENRQDDYKKIRDEVWRTEHGIRAIGVMYDDHSSDKKSKENIFLLKDNIEYRLFSAVHQYLIFLRELGSAEEFLQTEHKKKPHLFNAFPMGNPYFDKVELELSSVFDSIIFQVSSVFDYFSHMICYICKNDKSKTLYWTKLASSVRGDNNEFSELPIKGILNDLDKEFVGRLYDYRSRLLHNKRDQHKFSASVLLSDFNFSLKILASDTSLKHFKAIRDSHKDGDITLTFLASWLLKKTFSDIEIILDSLREHILKNSSFQQNLRVPKTSKNYMVLSIDPTTNFAKSVSEALWTEYKNRKKPSS